MDINKAIATTVRTGKVLFGASNAVKNAKIGKPKLFIVAANCPTNVREDIEYYCNFSGLPVISHSGTSIDLGAACGKPFTVSVITIKEPGDSDILKLAEAANV
ncbi:50S ribosomal protein L30e [Candidatus Bathyarchaeota archaeon]|nr:50S ribosomal protein L30e [Candidatus Bathyarchaeota archaeon]